MSVEGMQRTMARHGAAMMVATLLVGGLAALSMSGSLPLDGKMLLSAHVTGVVGVFFVIAVAWTLPMLGYGDAGRARLALAIVLANWANLVIGTAKAGFAVHGVGLTGELANDVVFVLLNLLVVVPTLAGSIAWFWGLRPAKTPSGGASAQAEGRAASGKA